MLMRWTALLLLAACVQAPAQITPDWADFANPAPVSIEGYDGDAMEPFLSRDGGALFFNNSNAPAAQTDLHWAERVNDTTFRYRGAVGGANSTALDGVASMSAERRFCFISTRSYEATLGTVYCGMWDGGAVEAAAIQEGASVRIHGRLMFDLELSASGGELIVADGQFRGGAAPVSADLRQARWREGGFELAAEDDMLFAAINTPALEYAAALSADGLTLAFTRLEGQFPFVRTSIWLARRDRLGAPFGAPTRVDAIEGEMVEGPSFSPDSGAIYFHRKMNGRYAIWRVTR